MANIKKLAKSSKTWLPTDRLRAEKMGLDFIQKSIADFGLGVNLEK